MKMKNTSFQLCKIFLVIAVLFFHVVCFAQVKPLEVKFKKISIKDTTVYRELPADFPYPVLSLIEVKDKNNLFVHGFADTTRWLGAQDTTQLGVIVDDIWDTILEYHQEDNSIPENSDVKQMHPQYLVTEVSNVQGEGISVALAMDYSGSMTHVMETVEKCAKQYIGNMKLADRTAIVKFAGGVEVYQDFTNDTTMLKEAIDRDYRYWRGTRLYDGIYKTIQLTMKEENRRTVIVYADGANSTASGHTMWDVINLAKANKIPVFTIGLGKKSPNNALQQIAEKTGGTYTYTSTGEDLTEIYLRIYGLIQGYYVLAHKSTDPLTNGTWRIVDVTLDYENEHGRGTGLYYVPSQSVDLGVFKEAVTDSMIVLKGDTLKITSTNDTVNYKISVINNGPELSGPVSIVDYYPESFELISSDIEPNTVSGDFLLWSIEMIKPGESVHIECSFYVDTVLATQLLPRINRVDIECGLDSTSYNNTFIDTVYYNPLYPPDIAVTKVGIGDSLVASGGDTTWYVFSADTVNYSIKIVNQGQLDCNDITVTDILPECLEFIDSQESYTLKGDTIIWKVDHLEERGDSRRFNYRCYIDTIRISDILPVVNNVKVESPSDTILHNNTARDTVFYVPLMPTDVSVFKQGIGDSCNVINNDTIFYVWPGDTFEYHVSLINLGQLKCENITVYDVLSEKVSFIDFSVEHILRNDTLIWVVDEIESNGGHRDFVYRCCVDTLMPPWDVSLINTITISSEDDTIYHNNTAGDTVWVVGVSPPDPEISAVPVSIEPFDSISVEVMTPVEIIEWNIEILFDNGVKDEVYWEDFIGTTELQPQIWTSLYPLFTETQMRTGYEKEKIRFVLITEDRWHVTRSDTARVELSSANKFYLESNTFRTSEFSIINMHFKLSSNRHAELIIYDVSGDHIKKIYDGPGIAGWNSAVWDGTNEQGESVGSGIYLAVLLSGEYKKYLKFILIR